MIIFSILCLTIKVSKKVNQKFIYIYIYIYMVCIDILHSNNKIIIKYLLIDVVVTRKRNNNAVEYSKC